MTLSNTDWFEQAVCRGKTELFFQKNSESRQARARRETVALVYCGQCPVQLQCRNYARENDEFGIWGGETDEMRWKAGYLRSANYHVTRSLRKRFDRQRQIDEANASLSQEDLSSTQHS